MILIVFNKQPSTQVKKNLQLDKSWPFLVHQDCLIHHLAYSKEVNRLYSIEHTYNLHDYLIQQSCGKQQRKTIDLTESLITQTWDQIEQTTTHPMGRRKEEK